MKNYQILLFATVLGFSSCGINNNASTSVSDSLSMEDSIPQSGRGLYGLMKIRDTIKAGEPVDLVFTVRNEADSAAKFLKWDTPYEPLLSKYLDIRDENGAYVDYHGAMAKRMMPPPADNYIEVKPGDSLQISVDLLQGYGITKPSKYTIVYVGGNISGLVVKDSVSFVLR